MREPSKVFVSAVVLSIIILASVQSIPVRAQSDLVFAFDTVHGDVDSTIENYVANKGWQTLAISSPLTLQYLIDNHVKVLHLSKFKTAFTDQEIREVKEWVDSGGIVMLAVRETTTPYWADLTRGFGITFDKTIQWYGDATWRAEVTNHPLLDGVKSLSLPYWLTLLNVQSPSRTLVTARQGSYAGPTIALYESKGKLVVYPGWGSESPFYGSRYDGDFSLEGDNYLFLGNGLRWFGQTSTVTPPYVTTTTETTTETSVRTVTETTLETTTLQTTLTTTRLTTTRLTTTSLTTTTSTETSTDYVNTALLLQGYNFVLGPEVAGGIVVTIVAATIVLYLLIRRTVRHHA